MKLIVGFMLILTSVIIGCYVGFYLMFFGGIIDIIEFIKILIASSTISTTFLLKGLFKIIFASIAGWLSFFCLFTPGLILLDKRKKL